MSILISEKQYIEIMELLNGVIRENAILMNSVNGNLTNNEKYVYRHIRKENKKYLNLIKTLDKNKKNKTLKSIITKWIECEITGDEAISQMIKYENIIL